MIKITNYTMKYDYDCGPTSIAIWLSAYGVNYRPDDLIKILKTTKENGTSWRRMKNFLKELGLFKIEENESILKAKKLLDKPTPLLVCWDVYGDPDNSHYSVLIKMDNKNVSILDPEDWEKFTIHKLEEFKQDWKPYSYWSVQLIPNAETKSKYKSSVRVRSGRTGNLPQTGILDSSIVENWIKQANK